MLDQMYTEIILEHNRNSPHKGQLETVTHTERGHNPNCGDDLTLHLEVEEGLIKKCKVYRNRLCHFSSLYVHYDRFDSWTRQGNSSNPHRPLFKNDKRP